MQTVWCCPRHALALWRKTFVFLCAILLSGCWAAAIKPPVNVVQQVHTLLLVPVEAPPLQIIPDPIFSRVPVYAQYQNMALDFALPQGLYTTEGGVLVAGLVGTPEDRPTIHAQVTPWLPSTELAAQSTWMPTLAVAQQAAQQLGAQGIKTVLSANYLPLPLVAAQRDAQLQHWQTAAVEWYAQPSSTADYRQQPVDAVLELGIANYRIFEGQTSVQLLLKLIDPASGRVLASTRAATFALADAVPLLRDDDSAPFKQVLTQMQAQLLRQCLQELGWTG